MSCTIPIFAAALLATTGTANAQNVNTIVNNGPTSNRYDMVILGDGYRAHEESKFNNDCQRFAQDRALEHPFGRARGHLAFAARREPGLVHDDPAPGGARALGTGTFGRGP